MNPWSHIEKYLFLLSKIIHTGSKYLGNVYLILRKKKHCTKRNAVSTHCSYVLRSQSTLHLSLSLSVNTVLIRARKAQPAETLVPIQEQCFCFRGIHLLCHPGNCVFSLSRNILSGLRSLSILKIHKFRGNLTHISATKPLISKAGSISQQTAAGITEAVRSAQSSWLSGHADAEHWFWFQY